MSNLPLTIIAVTYNSRHILDSFLYNLESYRNNLLIIDNGSDDDTVVFLKKNQIRVLALDKNLGFGQAANIGVAECITPFFCLVNPDCSPGSGLLNKGLEVLAGNPQSCIVPKKIIQSDNVYSGIQPGYTRLKLFKDILETNYGPSVIVRWLDNLSKLHDHSWYWPLGVCLIMTKDYFEKIGGFDPNYFMYCEDVDLGKRITNAGGSIIAVDENLLHEGRNSSLLAEDKKIMLINQGRLQYARLNYGRYFTIILSTLVNVSYALKKQLKGKFRS